MEVIEMKKGSNTRLPVLLLLLILPVTSVFGKFWMEITDINTNEKITGTPYIIQMKTYQIQGMEFSAYFENESTDKTIICWVRRKPGSAAIPGYVDGWKDYEVRLGPGEDTTLTNVIYIQPKSAGADQFTIEIARRDGTAASDPINAHRTDIIVRTVQAELSHPGILPEPEFTRGTSNTVRWIPVDGSASQDVYYFNDSDRKNLRKAVKGLYKALRSDTLSESFNNLKTGQKYGFVAKSVYVTDEGEEAYYSDIVYSTQDNMPPETVLEPQAILQGGLVSVSWNLVSDALSGVQSYRIYRSVDSGLEIRVDEIDAQWLTNGHWVDSSAVAGHYYSYRVRAVDRTGNQGGGDISNSVSVEGDTEEIIIGDDDDDTIDDAKTGPFIAGSIDTLWIRLDNRERYVRFEAARDSADYLVNNPPGNMRYFDTGWIVPDSLRARGWVSPTYYDSVYVVLDYTKSANIRAAEDGSLTEPEFERFDRNLIDGHSYIRQVSRRYFSTTHIQQLGTVIPDCFPPEDIHNLRLNAVIADPYTANPALGFTSCLMYLSWEKAADDVSGLSSYIIYRKIGSSGEYEEIDIPENFIETTWVDTVDHITVDDISNPLVAFRVVSRDAAGNERSIDSTDWEAVERIPGRPVLMFSTTEYPDVFPAEPSDADTVFTHEEYAELTVQDFDVEDILSWSVLVNNRQTEPFDVVSDTILIVKLSEEEVTRIRVRGVYIGNRSSVWSEEKTVIRALSLPPEQVSVRTDSMQWDGNIFARWEKPCIAARKYLVWRKTLSTPWTLVDTVAADTAVTSWTDYYSRNELAGTDGDKLTAFRDYTYGIQTVNIMGDTSVFAPEKTAYCNRPPFVVYHDTPKIEDGNYTLTIHWQRVTPSDASAGHKTAVRVYVDSLDNGYTEEYVVDDTLFMFRSAAKNNNYIFRIREIPNQPAGKMSSWSKPHTVSSLVTLPLSVVPQPRGKIYVNWDAPQLIQKYKVERFEIFRNEQQLQFDDPMITSFMDSSDVLVHKGVFKYGVYALDSLNQVVAANVLSDTADTGSVFIPEVAVYSQKYFNDDSINVSWVWRDINGNAVQATTRGAKTCRIQVSVSREFPGDAAQTWTTEPFAADAKINSKRVRIPELGNRTNEIVYFRITAEDAWGNPAGSLWSTDFYTQKKAWYDPVYPYELNNISVRSVAAYYHGADSIVTALAWDVSGVQAPGDTNEVWDNLIGNIAEYRVLRTYSGITEQVGTVPVNRQLGVYLFSDTLDNRDASWSITVVDSAGNATAGQEISSQYYLETPDSPEPESYKKCTLPERSSEEDTVYYYVELAMDERHYQIAYELGDEEEMNRLLCRSGWIAEESFECTSGWASIEHDTTWFRVKKGVQENGQWWESGWSPISYFTQQGGSSAKTTGVNDGVTVPGTFSVSPNYPNPFNSRTIIPYQVPEQADITVSVFNIAGSMVKKMTISHKAAGYYSVAWNGTNTNGAPVSSGVYICVIRMRNAHGKTLQSRIKLMYVK